MPARETSSSAAERAAPAAGLGISRALCAIDGGPGSEAAVRQAVSLLSPAGEVTLLLVTSHRSPGDRGSAIGPAHAQRIIDPAREILEAANVRHSVEVDPAAPPAEVIINWASGHDLLAIGAPDSSALGGVFVKGVGDSALEWLTIPVLVAREPGGASGEDVARRILVASDGGGDSDELVEIAAGLASAHNAQVTLLHAIGAESASHPHRIQEQARRLTQLAPDARLQVEPGHAHEAIVAAAASTDASLILMGSRGLTGLRVLGSVSHRVIHDAACSVLLVPPERLRAGWQTGRRCASHA